MNKTTMASLLGRPLTSIEDTNFETYLKIAKESLDDLLCMSLCNAEDPRVFDVREGYKTVYFDVFSELNEIRINGVVIAADQYEVRQNDIRQSNWYNSVVFTDALYKDDVVTVSADWGFNGNMPTDLQSVLAGLFGLVTAKNKFDGSIKSKGVEDFKVTFDNDADLDDLFYKQNSRVIAKYSLCDKINITNGEVC